MTRKKQKLVLGIGILFLAFIGTLLFQQQRIHKLEHSFFQKGNIQLYDLAIQFTPSSSRIEGFFQPRLSLNELKLNIKSIGLKKQIANAEIQYSFRYPDRFVLLFENTLQLTPYLTAQGVSVLLDKNKSEKGIRIGGFFAEKILLNFSDGSNISLKDLSILKNKSGKIQLFSEKMTRSQTQSVCSFDQLRLEIAPSEKDHAFSILNTNIEWKDVECDADGRHFESQNFKANLVAAFEDKAFRELQTQTLTDNELHQKIAWDLGLDFFFSELSQDNKRTHLSFLSHHPWSFWRALIKSEHLSYLSPKGSESFLLMNSEFSLSMNNSKTDLPQLDVDAKAEKFAGGFFETRLSAKKMDFRLQSKERSLQGELNTPHLKISDEQARKTETESEESKDSNSLHVSFVTELESPFSLSSYQNIIDFLTCKDESRKTIADISLKNTQELQNFFEGKQHDETFQNSFPFMEEILWKKNMKLRLEVSGDEIRLSEGE